MSVNLGISDNQLSRTDLMFDWTNPKQIDLTQPYLYFIKISAEQKEFRYIGKASKKARLNEYKSNVAKILEGKSRRPVLKRDGSLQSQGNLKYRYVHLVLANAQKRGWDIEHYPIENVAKQDLNSRELTLINELECNMNDGSTWFIEQFSELSEQLLQTVRT